MNKFAERLHQLRTVSNYENGIHCPDLDTLCRIARYYGVSTDYILGITDCPYSVETLNQVIADGYTVGQFLALLDRLPDDTKEHLVWILRLFGR